MAKPMNKTISEQQIRLNQELHQKRKDFGNRADTSGLNANLCKALSRMHELGVCRSVLDYGTGKGKLVKRLRQELPGSIAVAGYDPAVEQFSLKPSKSVDVLLCFDVLEHIEMANIKYVLEDIDKLTDSFCYLIIDLQPANKILSNGRNAHILLAPPEWWISRISQLFPCLTSFPIMHCSGLPQKLVIAACKRPAMVPYMQGFLSKLQIFEMMMAGGILGEHKQ